MDLKFSHVDVLVNNLDEACAYYAQILNARISKNARLGTRWSARALPDKPESWDVAISTKQIRHHDKNSGLLNMAE